MKSTARNLHGHFIDHLHAFVLYVDAQYGRCVRVLPHQHAVQAEPEADPIALHLLSVMCRLASHSLVHIGVTTSWTTNAPSCSRRRHSLASVCDFRLCPSSSSISLRSSVRLGLCDKLNIPADLGAPVTNVELNGCHLPPPSNLHLRSCTRHPWRTFRGP